MFKLIVILLYFIMVNSVSYSAGSSSNEVGKGGLEDESFLNVKNSNLKKGKDAINQAKKYAIKNKNAKSQKRFEDAIKYLLKANEDSPNNPDILNLLGYSYRKVNDFIMAELYYNQGLKLDPTHVGINEYLGELYFQTNRLELANQRLEVLRSCNCEEFEELKEIIAGTKKSK